MTAAHNGVFAAALADRRTRFNALFAEARRFRPSLDLAIFQDHLKSTVAPIVERAAEHAPAQAGAVTAALYELSLDLVGQEFLGMRSRYPALVAGWQRLLPALAAHVAAEPRRVPGAITNALYHLSTTPQAQPQLWMDSVLGLAAAGAETETLLAAAQAAAWRAGLAHYRQGAIDLCRRLPPRLAAMALGLPASAIADATAEAGPERLERALARLRDDPWLDPAEAWGEAAPKRRLQLVRRVGAFRGFGGLFMAPPTVTCPAGQFVVSDGADQWLLCADRFGATLHRTTAATTGPARMAEPFYRLDSRGKVTRGKHNAVFPELAGSQSSAADEATLAVTTALSHAVFLIALVAA
jgi:hypothetical protein